LAAAVRVLFLLGTTDRGFPFSLFYYGDSRHYRELALALLEGRLYDSGIPFHPPLFAWLYAGLIAAIGARPTLLRAALAVVAALVVPLTWALGRKLLDRRSASVAALLATFSFALCVLAVSPNNEVVYLPLLVGQALLAVALGDAAAAAGGRRLAALAGLNGLLVGLGALARAEHLAFAALVPLAVWIAAPRAGARRQATAAAVLLLAAAATLAPWVLHSRGALVRFNAAHPELAAPLPTWVPVTSYGALNFALANRPQAAGGFDPRPVVGERGAGIDLRQPRHLDLYLHGYRHGLRALAGDPAAAARLLGRKLRLTLDGWASGLGVANRPAGLSGERRPVDLFAPDRRWLVPLLLALAAAGAWRARAAWRRGAIVGLVLAHKLGVALAFFGYARLAAQVLPFALLLAAAALVGAWERLPRPAPRRHRAAAGVIVVVALALELVAAAARPRDFVVSGSADAAGKIVQDARLRIAPR
jgi:hypothetical protein